MLARLDSGSISVTQDHSSSGSSEMKNLINRALTNLILKFYREG